MKIQISRKNGQTGLTCATSFDPEALVFIDETGISNQLHTALWMVGTWQNHASEARQAHGNLYSTVAAISLAGVGMATTVEGAFNKASLKVYGRYPVTFS